MFALNRKALCRPLNILFLFFSDVEAVNRQPDESGDWGEKPEGDVPVNETAAETK